MVAAVAAFLALGSVLFWGLTRGNMDLLSKPLVAADVPASDSDQGLLPSIFGAEEEAGTRAEAETRADGAITRAEEVPLSARERLAEQAAVRREANSSRWGTWNRFRAGGATAGIAGFATTTGADAVGEEVIPDVETAETPDEIPPTAAAPAGASLSEAATAEADPNDAINFTDVPDNYWAKPYIDALSSRGLTAGFEDGTFKPDAPVTRGQIANIVSRTFNLVADKETLAFSDVGNDYWAREPIEEVVKGGFMTGFPDDTFKPDAPVTRIQSLTTLVTGLGIAAPTNVQAALSRYGDANAIPNWANEKAAAATAGGLVVNYPELEQLNPNEPTTRAELAAFIYQALAREEVVEPVESEYLVKP